MKDTQQDQSPLDFEATTTSKKKRKYVFDFHKARVCDHPRLQIVTRGTSLYRCLECNYAFWLPTATMWPLHWMPIQGFFMIGSFVKEFGLPALEQVFHTPIGTVDGTPHKPVLPEGKSLVDVLNALHDLPALADQAQRWMSLPPGVPTPDGHDNSPEGEKEPDDP